VYDKAVDSGQVRELSARHLGRAGIRGGILGGTLDAGIGAGQDYFAGASRSKLASNAKINFTFGATEGAIVGVAFAVNPIFGVFALAAVFGYEYKYGYKHRYYWKERINSLE